MKKFVLIFVMLLMAMPSCKKTDVFALWRDPSYLVINTESTNFFTMMQYNIFGADNGWDSNRFDRVAAVINSNKPDFVSLNEVDSMTSRNKFFMAKELANRTGMQYAFAPAREPWSFNWPQDAAYGDAVLSKYPIQEIRRFKLYPDPAQGDQDKEDRSVCAIRVNLNGESMWIASTHFDHRAAETSRIYQARQLQTVISELEGTLLVCGDLNADPTSGTMEVIFSYLQALYPSNTPEYYTCPANYNGEHPAGPTALIDYILMRKDEQRIECVSYRVDRTPASDHCAVIATFKIREQ